MDYEECLKKAYAEGWRDPVRVSILEIEAYQAGMRTERNRVMFLFRGLDKESQCVQWIYGVKKQNIRSLNVVYFSYA